MSHVSRGLARSSTREPGTLSDQQRQVSVVGASSAKQKHSFSGLGLFLGQFVSFGAPYGFVKIANWTITMMPEGYIGWSSPLITYD